VVGHPEALADELSALLRQAHGALAALGAAVRPPGTERDYLVAWRLVDRVGDSLARAAARPDCPARLGASLLDWRDRLGSHLLAADQLRDVGHPIASRARVLERGIRSTIGELLSVAAVPAAAGAPVTLR
jgi:hypothetical protein